ncbi:hypothetical protein ABGB14_23190 [Nonomuraea sp. B10E15]|uniref:hypothetical protein n=1 Tax=Nonomuraea sp. B10E15 TaxID=3153560 RepID=UPI00325D0DF0
MQIRRTLGLVMAGATLASTWLVAGATSASAAGPCGAGYARVGVYAINGDVKRHGTIEVYYNAGNGKNCALTYGYGSFANAENYKTAKIRPSGGSTDNDHGWFKYYAGPVYAKAPSKCIDVYGAVGGAGRWLRGVHCG